MRISHIGHVPRRFGYAAGGTIPPSLYPTLFEALRARVLSGESRLRDCYRRQPPDKWFSYPYAIYNDLNESPDWVSQVNVYPSWVNVQITVVSPDDEEAEDLRDSCFLLFTPKRNPDGTPVNPPLVFGDGGMPPFGYLPGLKTQYRSPGRSAEGRPLWLFSFALMLYITRGM